MNGSTYDKVLDAVKVVGFPVVMCFVFIAWEAGWLPSRTRDLVRIAESHDIATRDLATAINALRAASRAQVLLTTCLSYARTAEVQQKCVEQYQKVGL